MTAFTSFCHKAFFVVTMLLATQAVQAQFVYVKSTASGLANGSSWTDAYADLQIAMDRVTTGDTILVAGGTYLPSFRLGGDSLRNSTFYFNRDMTVIGGFSGESGTEGDLESRDLNLHPSILSGDLGIPGDDVDNAFHVVYIDHVSDTFKLDGFVIEKGSGVNGAVFDAIGSGIFNSGDNGRSHPTFAHCVIRHNRSGESGGGYASYASGGKANPRFTHCSFIRNIGGGGGAMSFYTDNSGESNPILKHCQFIGNTALTAQGGAISCIGHSSKVSPSLINCTFTGNHSPTSQAINIFLTGTGESEVTIINCTFAGNSGGVIRSSNIGTGPSKIIARNSIFFGNGGGGSNGITLSNDEADIAFCLTEFFSLGQSNIFGNPNFIQLPALPVTEAHTDGDVHIAEDSPAIDMGDNVFVPADITSDLDGLPRFVNPFNGMLGRVDMGAYEIQESTSDVAPSLPESAWRVYPNPTTESVMVRMENASATALLKLIDLNGRPVHTSVKTSCDEVTLDVSNLPAGIYLLQAEWDGKSGTKVIVKE